MHSDSAEMIAVTGRRRVGKTFLIRSILEGRLDFEITGIHNGTLEEQLENFSRQLAQYGGLPMAPAVPATWLEAFWQLRAFLEKKRVRRKRTVFIDELPWLAGPRSGFMKGLENFWNSWASQHNIVIVLCGSAATWMLRQLIHNRGGLHNRITRNIRLEPFDLRETQQFLESRKVTLNHYQTIQVYMVTGGIPHYLKEVQSGQSAAQNIDRICFEPQGLLKDEFVKLYASLFGHPENHIKVIRELSQHRRGLTRKEIVAATGLPDGGRVSSILQELDSSGFISAYLPFGKQKKETLYRLTDEYSLFYLKFMERGKAMGQGAWLQLSQSQAWKAWAGYAFENICLKHVSQIKRALGIQGVYAEVSSFYFRGDDERPGMQVDLLIDRKDQVVNLCELKFYEGPFTLTKDYAQELRERLAGFRERTRTRKQVMLTMVTAFGLRHNEHSIGLVQAEVEMEALFAPA